MSLADLCDVAYVMQVEQAERVALALTASAADVEADLVERLRDEFDAALVADAPRPRPTPAGSGRLSQMHSLLTDLGVA